MADQYLFGLNFLREADYPKNVPDPLIDYPLRHRAKN